MIAIAAEAVGHKPQPFTKVLIIVTLALAWLFSNTIYALHYAHLAYSQPDDGLHRPRVSRDTAQPVYWDFVYFSFTCGMAFATSDVTITSEHIRRVVTVHCLAAFAFNIGVLAFTINLLGQRARRQRRSPAARRFAASRDQAAADDQNRAGQGVERHRLTEHEPAERRRPEERAIFGDGEIARFAARIAPGEQQGALRRHERQRPRSSPIGPPATLERPTNGIAQQPQSHHRQRLEEVDLERLRGERLMAHQDDIHGIA